MCQSCVARSTRLRALADEFAGLSDRTVDPAIHERLRTTADDLYAVAGRLLTDCGANDVVWAEPAEDEISDGLFEGGHVRWRPRNI
ncbi:MAG TPA: hypothetical protein VG757_05660 [Devosia sp.]|nr:hypothetical protein [Devosia sp.]